jgi:hypothetical protein
MQGTGNLADYLKLNAVIQLKNLKVLLEEAGVVSGLFSFVRADGTIFPKANPVGFSRAAC